MSKNDHQDITGKGRIVRNVLASWGGQLIFIIAGFILPRVIDNSLGAASLGVWDFAWSIISYFGLMQGGIGASVNRYVAKYRTEGNQQKVNESVSSAMSVQILAGFMVLASSALLAYYAPVLFGHQLEELTQETQWVIFLVGSGLAVQMFFDAFVGVITAHHRWDIHNAINAGVYMLTTIAMIIALLSGGGLIGLALANFCGTVVTELTRMFIAFRIAPDLKIRPRYVKFSTIKTQLAFGGKMLLPSISKLLMLQTVNILIMSYLGPALLALFARPMALIRHVNTIIGKYAFILTPIASSIQSKKNTEELRQMFIDTSRSSYYMTLPMILGLAFLGEELLYLWMGKDYATPYLISILAVGYLFTIAHSPVFSFLMGLNFHGRPGLARFVASLFVALSAFIVLEFFDGGLLSIALSIAIPLMIADGIYMPWFACKKLDIPFSTYYREVALRPLIILLPYTGALALSKVFIDKPGMTLLAGFIGGVVTVLPLYWRYVLPKGVKEKITRKLQRRKT